MVSLEVIATYALGIFLMIVGASHFVLPGYYRTLVPPWPWLPRAHALVVASGGAEIMIGVGLLLEPTRTIAAWVAVVLFVGYVITHLDALVRASPTHARWLDRPAGAVARVLVNGGYLVWAVFVAVWLSTAGV